MSNRIALFRSNANEPIYKNVYKKLGARDLQICEEFILKNDHLGKDEFTATTIRWWLDNPNKPKRWSVMQDLVMSVARGEL